MKKAGSPKKTKTQAAIRSEKRKLVNRATVRQVIIHLSPLLLISSILYKTAFDNLVLSEMANSRSKKVIPRKTKSLELMGIESMIYQYLQSMTYIETLPVFLQDASLQPQLANISNEELLNLVDVNGDIGNLNDFLTSQQDTGNVSLLRNLIAYYTKIGSSNLLSNEAVRLIEQNVICLCVKRSFFSPFF